VFGGAGHGPYVPYCRAMFIIYIVATFPVSMNIFLFDLNTGFDMKYIIIGFCLNPALNALLWGWLINTRMKKKGNVKDWSNNAKDVTGD
jgi:hypothetical protein